MSAGLDDTARHLNLRGKGGERRGRCPACGYPESFVLSIGRSGKVIGWCASCQDREAIGAILWDGRPAAAAPRAAPARSNAPPRDAALRLWHSAVPASGTLVDAYLAGRGLVTLAASPALRFRADCPHPGGGRLPAMVAAVTNAAGQLVAVHRTFLLPDGGGKAHVEPQRASLGPVWGGAVRLTASAPNVVPLEIAIGEGIESSASAGRLLNLTPWAAVSAGNLGSGVALPPEVRRVTIAVDNDPPGRRAAREAWTRWRAEGRQVQCATPDDDGADMADVLMARLAQAAAP